MQPFISFIMPWPATRAIQGWMFCQGQQLSINQYSALYMLLGTTYGGNGVSTFNIPDLRGRVPVGANMGVAAGYTLGSYGGSETAVLTPANLPPHTHAASLPVQGSIAVQTSTGNATAPTPSANAMLAVGAETDGFEESVPKIFGPVDSNSVALGGFSATLTGTPVVGNAGVGAQSNNMNPYQVLNYLIAVEGLFPPQP